MSEALPIFVLTLPGAEPRRAPLLARLGQLGLDHELLFGVDGRKSLPAEFEPMVDRTARVNRNRRPLTDGEYACALSHLSFCRTILARGLPRALLLEDDAIIGTALAALVRGEIAVAGDLLTLDHWQGMAHRTGQVALGGGYTAHRVARIPFLSTGYVMSAAGARHFLAHALPVRMLPDWSCDISRMASYMVHPRIVDHADIETGASDLRDARKVQERAFRYRSAPRSMRWFTAEFWRRRIDKRLYRRLDERAAVDLPPPAAADPRGA
ncbi:MAG: glycosyltransferase family 25 protein [Thermohalobaculum sp.]|nr:glycosyltransferase family 25 protein [Thermohalobaculum sp.]